MEHNISSFGVPQKGTRNTASTTIAMAGRTGCGCLRLACLLLAAYFAIEGAAAFSPGRGSPATKSELVVHRRGWTETTRPRRDPIREDRSRRRRMRLEAGDDGGDERIDATTDASCWNPSLRRKLAAASSLGLLETSWLTYDKLSGGGGGSSSLAGALCTATGGGCAGVLDGPYSTVSVGGAEVPLAAIGAAAYGAVLALSAAPLVRPGGGGEPGTADGNNRIALLGLTTLMASFSAYLVSLVVGVLHTTCVLCFVSAGLSAALAGLSWTGGVLPEGDGGGEDAAGLRRTGLAGAASSVGVATAAALALFLSADGPAGAAASPPPAGGGGTLLASAGTGLPSDNRPPPITTRSSREALDLASDMNSLDARMFGAFWCSHCYEQKQALGLEAMRSIPYVECDREGYNGRRDLCKEKEVPGYPTWEINGELFPGERSLGELREIVDDILKDK